MSVIPYPSEFDSDWRDTASQVETWEAGEYAELLESVVEEGRENLELLANGLVKLERSPKELSLVNALFRAAHNLKGLSRVIPVQKLYLLSAAMENRLESFRSGVVTADSSSIDSLLQATDILSEEIFPAIQKCEPIALDLEGIIDAIHGVSAPSAEKGTPSVGEAAPAEEKPAPAAEEPAPAAEKPAPASSPASAGAPWLPGARAGDTVEHKTPGTTQRFVGPEATGATEEFLRVHRSKLDRMLNLASELVIHRSRFGQRASHLRQLSHELSRLKERLHALSLELRRWGREEERSAPGEAAGAQAALPGELREVVEESDRLKRVFDDLTRELLESTDHLGRISVAMQEGVMEARMVPVHEVFRIFPSMVRRLARSLGRFVRLDISGEQTECDKLLVEQLGEPLMHLLRNALDHGIESPEERRSAGKPQEGVLALKAYHQEGQLLIEVSDDGRGINARAIREAAVRKGLLAAEEAAALSDEDSFDYLFQAGFSTAQKVTDLSGRGVGLDVVKESLARLKGSLTMESQLGRGTRLRLRLPLTLAIIQALLVRVGSETLALPLNAVQEMISADSSHVHRVGRRHLYHLRNNPMPIYSLAELLGMPSEPIDSRSSWPTVVIGFGERRLGLRVDSLQERQDVVVKGAGRFLTRLPFTLGATILGDGRVVLILDPQGLYDEVTRLRTRAAAPQRRVAASVETAEEQRKQVLVVEDSPTMRARLVGLLREVGFEVTEAQDGQEGLHKASGQSFDLITADIMMPHMDGYEMTRELRKLPQYRHTPIIMISSRGSRMDKMRGFDAGADDYLAKPVDRESLLQVIRNNLRMEL